MTDSDRGLASGAQGETGIPNGRRRVHGDLGRIAVAERVTGRDQVHLVIDHHAVGQVGRVLVHPASGREEHVAEPHCSLMGPR